MIRLIVLSAAAIPVALAFNSQSQESASPATTLAEAALAQEETPASIWWAGLRRRRGLEDALAITGAGEPQLLKNLGDGEFANTTRAAGLAGVTGARFAAWGDVDSDGTPDLYVGTASGSEAVRQPGGRRLRRGGGAERPGPHRSRPRRPLPRLRPTTASSTCTCRPRAATCSTAASAPASSSRSTSACRGHAAAAATVGRRRARARRDARGPDAERGQSRPVAPAAPPPARRARAAGASRPTPSRRASPPRSRRAATRPCPARS